MLHHYRSSPATNFLSPLSIFLMSAAGTLGGRTLGCYVVFNSDATVLVRIAVALSRPKHDRRRPIWTYESSSAGRRATGLLVLQPRRSIAALLLHALPSLPGRTHRFLTERPHDYRTGRNLTSSAAATESAAFHSSCLSPRHRHHAVQHVNQQKSQEKTPPERARPSVSHKCGIAVIVQPAAPQHQAPQNARFQHRPKASAAKSEHNVRQRTHPIVPILGRTTCRCASRTMQRPRTSNGNLCRSNLPGVSGASVQAIALIVGTAPSPAADSHLVRSASLPHVSCRYFPAASIASLRHAPSAPGTT